MGFSPFLRLQFGYAFVCMFVFFTFSVAFAFAFGLPFGLLFFWSLPRRSLGRMSSNGDSESRCWGRPGLPGSPLTNAIAFAHVLRLHLSLSRRLL